MKAVIQKVSEASVSIDGIINGAIEKGLVVLIGFAAEDNFETIKWMCNKISKLRVFPDDEGKMNLSVSDVGGGILFISNFTVYGHIKSGSRPSFTNSAPPETAKPLYDKMLTYFKNNYSFNIESGKFGAMMQVRITNDGPVTIILEK